MASTDINKQNKAVHIGSLEKMEQIVKRNRMLSWDGWDVIHHKPSPTAWRSRSGVFVSGKWYIQKRFAITETGWNIPHYIMR